MLIQKRNDGIMMIQLQMVDQSTCDQVIQQLHLEPDRHHLRILYDVRNTNWDMTDCISREVHPFSSTPDYSYRSIALLTDPSILGLTQMAIKRLPRASAANIGLFLTEEAALDWLEERQVTAIQLTPMTLLS